MTASERFSPEIFQDSEPAERQRLPYGAVPLDPDVYEDDGRRYGIASLERITEKLTLAMDGAEVAGWVASPELKRAYHKMLEISLYDSQVQRMMKNRLPAGSVDETDPRVVAAMNGFSTPEELLEVLVDCPALGSIEMAKLSHPLDMAATWAMDMAIAEAIVDKGGEVALETPRYKPKNFKAELPAATILRKQVVGRTPEGIQIVSKKAFLVRGDKEVRATTVGRYIDRKVRQGFRYSEEGAVEEGLRFRELADEIEATLPGFAAEPYLRWLQPIASSYYAKYVKE